MTATHAPMENVQNVPKTPEKGSTVSYTRETAKQALFEAINAQNVRFGAWEKEVKDRFQKKIDKFSKRGFKAEKAEEMASKQVQRVRARVFKDKLATPGTKGHGDFYKNVGDADGEGAIFLLKRYIFDKKQSFTSYLSHEDIEKYASSNDLNDTKVLKFFLDGGGFAGVNITTGETRGLRSPWTKSKIVMDHHPEGPTSTTGMAARLLQLTHMIPEKDMKAVKKFVQTIDIADSFLSRAGRTLDVEKDYAKTLVAFSYQLDSDELFRLCEKLPDNVGALTPLSDEQLNNIEVTMKGKKDKVKLTECVAKKQANVNTGKEMIDEKIKQKHFVTIEGKKFLIFGPKDNISNDVRALLSASHDFGTIKIHETGDMFIVHDAGIPPLLNTITHTIRDVIMVINANTTNNKLKESVQKLYDLLPESEGKKLILSLLGTLLNNPEVKEKITETIAQVAPTVESFVEKVAESPVAKEVLQTPTVAAVVNQVKDNIPSELKKEVKEAVGLPTFGDEIKKDFAQFGTALGGLWGSFTKWLKKGR